MKFKINNCNFYRIFTKLQTCTIGVKFFIGPHVICGPKRLISSKLAKCVKAGNNILIIKINFSGE